MTPRHLTVLAVFYFLMQCCLLPAQADNGQNEIIMLNDSASAIEDTDPKLSKELVEFASEKEKIWLAKNADKNAPLVVIDKKETRERIDQLKKAVLQIKDTYPLIAAGLNKMAKELQESIKNEK